MPRNKLHRSMKKRHISMLSLGSAIGTGLFLNSGLTISQAGPGGAIFAFLFGGLLIYLIMTCLGELSIQMPVTGSFQTYARKYIGPATSFMVGWIYWLGTAVIISVELTAASVLMQRWTTEIPEWIWCAIFTLVLFLLNTLSTKNFAESGYWLVSVKILAVVVFIILGLGAIAGIIPISIQPNATGIVNLLNFDTLFPHGFLIVLVTMMNVIFSYQGCEVIGIAAGESSNPTRHLPQIIRGVTIQLILLYVIPVVIIATLLPYQEQNIASNPFVQLFDAVNIPYAGEIMNFIILTAVLSVGNSCLYSGSRILWSMSEDKIAHPLFGKINKNGVPMNALLLTVIVSLLSLLTSVLESSTVYIILISVSGISVTISWAVIVISQINFRKQFLKSGGRTKDLPYAAPGYPYLPILSIIMCIIIMLFPALDETQRTGFYYSTGFVLLCYIYYYLKQSIQLKLSKAHS